MTVQKKKKYKHLQYTGTLGDKAAVSRIIFIGTERYRYRNTALARRPHHLCVKCVELQKPQSGPFFQVHTVARF
jgi:hypothetical protein